MILNLHTWCKKKPGPGGNSSIKGNITLLKYDASTNTFSKKYPAADVEVYIIYGNDHSYGDRIRTDYEGDFEFKYLRKGKYKIYFYSTDTIAYIGPPSNPKAPKIPVIREVEITKNNQSIHLGEMFMADD
ncbi:MAG: hypothetical protein N3F09_04860 [Bacteroidia bacterium]|nr:hypothetical protein [Bacteroidia bacterium]